MKLNEGFGQLQKVVIPIDFALHSVKSMEIVAL